MSISKLVIEDVKGSEVLGSEGLHEVDPFTVVVDVDGVNRNLLPVRRGDLCQRRCSSIETITSGNSVTENQQLTPGLVRLVADLQSRNRCRGQTSPTIGNQSVDPSDR